MYRSMENYLRFGQNHIFINFTEYNLETMKLIDEAYGRGIRTKKVYPKDKAIVKNQNVWSGKIHIFVDFVNINVSGTRDTFELLSFVKETYGEIFKIIVHLYSGTAKQALRDARKNRIQLPTHFNNVQWMERYYMGVYTLQNQSKGKMVIFVEKIYQSTSFEIGFTRVTVQRTEDDRLEVVTTIIQNTRDTNVMQYEPYRLTQVYNRRRIPRR